MWVYSLCHKNGWGLVVVEEVSALDSIWDKWVKRLSWGGDYWIDSKFVSEVNIILR